MIFGLFALALNTLTIASLSFALTVLLLAQFSTAFGAALHRFDAVSRSRLLWCVAILPWLVGVLAVTVLLFPELFEWGEFWLTSSLHWHHIYNFPLFSWHGASVIVFATLSMFVLAVKFFNAVRMTSGINQLNDFLQPETLPNGCVLIESDNIAAFTSGLFQSKAYITRGLHSQLNEQENQIVQMHELAHCDSADPSKKYIFSLFASFFPKRMVTMLNKAFSLALEQRADEQVCERMFDAELVSKTIVKVARLQAAAHMRESNEVASCAFSANPLELRIRYLLNEHKGDSLPYIVVGCLVLTMATINIFSVDFFHHSFEQLFSH